jgi:O-antigen/teichoic acid export membrane protein
MTYAYGKEGSLAALWERAWKATALVLAVMLPLAIAASLTIPWLVPTLFPKYSPGARAAQILVFAALFYGAAIGVNALWSMKAWAYMVTYQVTGSMLRVLGPFLGVSLHGDPLSGVAWGMLGANATQMALGLCLTYHATHARRRESKLTG